MVSGVLPARSPLSPADSSAPEGRRHLLADSHQVPLPLQPPGPLQHIPGSGRAVSSETPLPLAVLHHESLQCAVSLKSTVASSQSRPLNSPLSSSKINPRGLRVSRVCQGLLFSTPECLKSPVDLVRLWLHEAERVYGDKLVDERDQKGFGKLLVDTCKKFFAVSCAGK